MIQVERIPMYRPNRKSIIRFLVHIFLITGLLGGIFSIDVSQKKVKAKDIETGPELEQRQIEPQMTSKPIYQGDEPEPGTFAPERPPQGLFSTAFDSYFSGTEKLVMDSKALPTPDYEVNNTYSALTSGVVSEVIPPDDLLISGVNSSAPAILGAANSLPAGLSIESIPAGKITIDMDYDVVMGWVAPNQAVSVIASSISGYGYAVADAKGFFWTPIWHNTQGHQLGISCGSLISITHDGGSTTTLSPKCLTFANLDVLTDTVSGGIDGMEAGIEVTASLGGFDIGNGGTPPSPGAPTTTATTSTSGEFIASFTYVDLGVESLVALDFDQEGVNIRNYVAPKQVFMVQQMNSIAGYADIDQSVTATIYEGSSTTVRWSGLAIANGPHGYYLFEGVSMNIGDAVEVQLDGITTLLSTTVPALGNFSFDADADTLHGTGPSGRPIRAYFWGWEGENLVYSETQATAVSDAFDITFGSDLQPCHDVMVVAADTQGNQVQILSGPPFVNAYQDAFSDTDCVMGRMDAPGVPIIVSLTKVGEPDPYVRDTGWVSDVGNRFSSGLNTACFIIREPDWLWGPINFDPGDNAAISTGLGWSESVEVIGFDWSYDTAGNTISGQSIPVGEVEVNPYQWMYDRYPLYGTATHQVDISETGTFTAPFSQFDVRDGQTVELAHFNTDGMGNLLSTWGQPNTSYFELELAHSAIGGVVATANDLVTARLYESDDPEAVLLATTSEDGDDDPYRFWLWNFGGHSLEPGMKVVVSSESLWSAEMVIPELTVNGDYANDSITGSGPESLLFVETYRDDASLGLFVPSTQNGAITLRTDYYGHDLRQGDYVVLTYQAPDGNRARQEVRVGDLYLVGHWFNLGVRDWMWGEAVPGSTVTITTGGETISTYFEDPNCSSCWGLHEPIELKPGDVITVSSSLGGSITYSIPSPLTATADSTLDRVSGQIGGRVEDSVNVYTWWDGSEYQVTTGSDGSFNLENTPETSIDVPRGGEGHILFSEIQSDVQVNFLQHYRTPDLMLDIFPQWDSIEGQYLPGHTVTIEVRDSTDTLRATATMTTEDIDWWDGRTGFSTDMAEDVWVTERPDIILPTDKIYAEVDNDGTIYEAFAQVGEITGIVDAATDSISGTINAPWLINDPANLEEISVECHPWGAPGGADVKTSSVIPDGDPAHIYTCAWDPDTEWNIDYNQDIGVVYREPQGHQVFWSFSEPSLDLNLQVNYDHDWIQGNYPAGHDVTLTVKDSDGSTFIASTRITTTEFPSDWGGGTGFSTNFADVEWDPERPDIQPGDWVFGDVTVEEIPYHSEVHLGMLSGQLDADTNTFTGTVSVPWGPPYDEVAVQCHPWGAPGDTPSKETTVLPDGLTEFSCGWDPATEWDVQPGQEIAVLYLDPAGHWVYSVHPAYTDELILSVHYDHEWVQGYYEAGHQIYLQVRDSGGNEKAHINLTSIEDFDQRGGSGFQTNTEGVEWQPYQPDIQPGDTIYGEVDDQAFTALVEIGTVTGLLDLVNNQVSGTISADWIAQEVRVSCEIWQENSPQNKEDWVMPNGADPYLCDWSSDGYDLDETSNLMVAYFESAGHKLIGDFSYPSARLRIEKWLEGAGEAGEGGNVNFMIQYRNEGDTTAINTRIVDTFGEGLTYISDTSGITPLVQGDDVTWELGNLDPGDWVSFRVFAHVTALEGETISNSATISSNTYDEGNPEDRTRTWSGTVIENDTHLNVGKGTWTGLPAPGEDFVYNINVCNNGWSGSTELTLTETLPDVVALVSWWGREDGWFEKSSSSSLLVLGYPSIPSWHCREVFIRVHLSDTAQVGAELINLAEIYAENDNPNEQDNQAWLQHNVGQPFSDLSVRLGWHSGTLVPGGQYRFGIYFYNDGNTPVPGPFPLTLTLPTGTSFAGWSYWDWAGLQGEPTVVGNQITWLIDALAPGYYGTIEVVISIDPSVLPGTILGHIVSIAVQEAEANTENNTAHLSETVHSHGPNLRISKWGDWHGDSRNAWYHLQIESIGDETVEDVLVTDYLPEGMVLDGGIGVNFWEWYEVTPYDNSFTAVFDRLEPGWNVGIDFNTRVPDETPIELGTILTNTANITLPENDSNPVDNSTSFDLTLTSGPKPYLHIDKWMTSGEPGVGGNARFHVQYINQGSAVATGVELTDTLVGMTYISDTSGITPTINGSEITWVIGNLEPGDWVHFDVFVQIDYGFGELLQNTIEMTTTSLYVDGDPSERISLWERLVSANETYLNLGINPWTWNPAVGQSYVYSYVICNNGATGSSEVTLNLDLPTNTIFEEWFWRELGWTELPPSEHTLVLAHPNIPSGQCYEVYAKVRVSGEAKPGDELLSNAEISADNDLSPDDNYGELHHNVGESTTDLSIMQNWHLGALTPGGYYRYAIVFRNEGNMAVPSDEDIYIIANLPAGTSFAGWDHWDWVDVGVPVVSGSQVSWKLNWLDPGFWGTIEIWLDIEDGTAPGTELVNTVEVTPQIAESNIGNNYSTLAEMVNPSGPNLRVSKWGDWHGYGEGHNAWYHLQVENIGDVTVEDVLVTDSLPTGMVLDGGIGVNFWDSFDVQPYGDYFTVLFDRLEPGWNVGMDFNVVIPVEGPIPQGLVFTNTVSVTQDPAETNPDDNSAEFILGSGPDMFVEKTWLEGEFKPGEQVTFLLEFGNKQPGHTPWWGMTGNAILVDTLPEGMSFVSSYWHCYQDAEWCELTPIQNGQELTWTTWPLGSGESQVIVLTVLINEVIDEENTLINMLEIFSDAFADDQDPFIENNTSSYNPEVSFEVPAITSADQITFTEASPGDFTVTTSGNPTPTLSQTGSLPDGVTFTDNGDGTATFAGTPAIGTEGVYEITITADNGVGTAATQTFTLTVVPAPVAPTITSNAFTTFTVGSAGTFTVTTTGNPPVNSITSTGALPNGVTLSSAGLLSGTPAVSKGGVYPIVITAGNGILPNATQNFILTVNEAPKITSANTVTFTEESPGTFTITTSGYPSAISITSSGLLPTGVSLVDQGDGTAILSGTPLVGTAGEYPITITANNGIDPNATQAFILIVGIGSGFMIFLPLILR